MTPSEISKEIAELKDDLQKLARVEIGMSNYREVMRKYQQLLYTLMSAVQMLADCLAERALDPQVVSVPESEKET